MTTDKIYLIGFMAAGKTSVGRALARRLGWRFEDIDDLIERRERSTVADIFARHGEPHFRQVEREMLNLLVPMRHVVAATGGGTFADPENRAVINRDGVSVWLDVPLPEIISRIPLDGRRPLAADRSALERLYRTRVESYRLAHVRIAAGRVPLPALVDRIAEAVADLPPLVDRSSHPRLRPVRYLVISDIHANLEALEAVMADARTMGYDQTVCLGDLVGYGAAPGEVIDQVLALEPVGLIRGNHDKVCAGLEPATNFNDAAREAAEWTHRTLSPRHLDQLVGLPKGPRPLVAGVEICHGAPFDEDYYVFDEGDAARAIASASDRVCLFGHTHVPAVFSTADDPALPSSLAEDELLLPRNGRVLINVGSVGQPRDGDPRAAYGLLDTERGAIRMRRVPYDIDAAQARIRKAGLPDWLAARLAKGR